jgi:hypothetical protein
MDMKLFGEENHIPFDTGNLMGAMMGMGGGTTDFGKAHYLRNVAMTLKDESAKAEIVSGLEAVMATFYPEKAQFQAAIALWEKALAQHISTHQDPFVF